MYLSGRKVTKELVIQYKRELMNKYQPVSVNTKLAAVNGFLKFSGYGNLRFQSELFFADRTMLFTDGFDRLEWNLPDPSQNASLRGWRFAPFGDNNERMGYLGELRFFCDALRSGAPADSRTSLDDCAETMRILSVVQQQFEERRAARK